MIPMPITCPDCGWRMDYKARHCAACAAMEWDHRASVKAFRQELRNLDGERNARACVAREAARAARDRWTAAAAVAAALVLFVVYLRLGF